MTGLRTVSAGRGAPMLFIPGFGLSPMTYLATIDVLSRRQRVVVPWLTGPDRRWSFDSLVDALGETLDDNELDDVALVGHSFGGAFAIGLAAALPDRVRSLTLVDALGATPGLKALAGRALRARNAHYATFAVAKDIVGGTLRRPLAVAAAARFAWRCDLHDSVAALRASQMRSAVLWAVDDALLPPLAGEQLATALGAEYVAVAPTEARPRIDHDWPYRHPQLFAEVYAEAMPA